MCVSLWSSSFLAQIVVEWPLINLTSQWIPTRATLCYKSCTRTSVIGLPTLIDQEIKQGQGKNKSRLENLNKTSIFLKNGEFSVISSSSSNPVRILDYTIDQERKRNQPRTRTNQMKSEFSRKMLKLCMAKKQGRIDEEVWLEKP